MSAWRVRTDDSPTSGSTVTRIRPEGEIGLIIPGYMYVHRLGRGTPHQTAIDSDDKIPGLKSLAETIHNEGGKVCFQLAHAGRQTTKEYIGQTPMAPSNVGRDPMYMVKPRQMTEDNIHEVIEAYESAAARSDGSRRHRGRASWRIISKQLHEYSRRRQ